MPFTKKNKTVDQTQFVVTGQFLETVYNGGSYSVALGYTDHVGAIKDTRYPKGQPGRYVEYVTSKGFRGEDRAKRFRFDDSLRRFLVRPSDQDIYGVSQQEFLKNHVECEGSPNGIYEGEGDKKVQTGVSFRELNSAKDAKIALEADKARIKAESTALELDEDTLTEVSNIIGYFGDADDLMRLKVSQYAKSYPSDFNSLMKDNDRGYRALIRRALHPSEGIFTTRGEVIKWEDLVIGKNEDDAVATLKREKDILNSLQDKLGLQVVENKIPKKTATPELV